MLRMTKCSWETLRWETMVTKSHRARPATLATHKVEFAAFHAAQMGKEQDGLCFRELLWANLHRSSSPADWAHLLIPPTCCSFTHLLNTHSLTHSLSEALAAAQFRLQPFFFVPFSVFVVALFCSLIFLIFITSSI